MKTKKTTYKIIAYKSKADFKKKKADYSEVWNTKEDAIHFAKIWIETNEAEVVKIQSSDKKFNQTITA